jgi:hypothetical protein
MNVIRKTISGYIRFKSPKSITYLSKLLNYECEIYPEYRNDIDVRKSLLCSNESNFFENGIPKKNTFRVENYPSQKQHIPQQPIIQNDTKHYTMCNSQYVYLLQEREFIRTKENVFKVGKTTQQGDMPFTQYPNGSNLNIQIECADCDVCETSIITRFKEEFTHKSEYGLEYFEGDKVKMINIIVEEVNKNYQDALENNKQTISEFLKNINHKPPTPDALLYMSKHTPELINEYLRLTR